MTDVEKQRLKKTENAFTLFPVYRPDRFFIRTFIEPLIGRRAKQSTATLSFLCNKFNLLRNDKKFVASFHFYLASQLGNAHFFSLLHLQTMTFYFFYV